MGESQWGCYIGAIDAETVANMMESIVTKMENFMTAMTLAETTIQNKWLH